MQMQGRKDGERVVNLGEGFVFDKMDEWSNSNEIKQDYPNLGDYLSSIYKNLTGEKQKKNKKEII